MDDAQLVAGALAGKAECYDELYRRYRGRAQGWMTRDGMPESEAEDRAQKVLAAVCRKLAQFDPSRAMFSTWVYGFIQNELFSYWRELGRHPVPDSLDDTPEECIAGDTDGPEIVHERRQVQEGVRELVCRLPPKLREPVVLFWFEEMTVAEIARFLKRPDSTVRDQLKEAMRELRELVRARPGPGGDEMSGAVQAAGGTMAYDRGDGVTSDAESVVLSEAEQALSDEFLELVRAGARPDLEQYLSRLPGSEARLRPILEGALLFGGEVERFKREHPGTSIFEWLCKGKGEGSRE